MKHLNKYFLQAAIEGHTDYIQKYIAMIENRTRIKAFMNTPFIEIAQLIKETGVDINTIYKEHESRSVWFHEWEYSALAMACKNNYTEKALWLISQGANVNSYYYEHTIVGGFEDKDEEDKLSPLMLSVKNNNIDLVSALIKAGADINFQGHLRDYRKEVKKTARDLALYEGNQEIIALLKAAGAKE